MIKIKFQKTFIRTVARALSLVLIVSSILVLMTGSSYATSSAQEEQISPEEFREKFTQYMAWLDATTSSDLEQKVRGLSEEEFLALYDSFTDPDYFVSVTDQIVSQKEDGALGIAGNEASSNLLEVQGIQSTTPLFDPGYPFGWDYGNWTATLPGLGLLLDTDGDGDLANERCRSDGEAEMQIAWATLEVAAIIGNATCESTSACGFCAGAAFCVAAGVLNEAVHANQIAIEQCSSQDGWVDSAEIEATYENTIILAGLADSHTVQLATHDNDIKAALEVVTGMIDANQAQLIKIEIEMALAESNDDKRLSYFYLPEANGGILEWVRQTVLDAINANHTIGISIDKAQSIFDQADASFAAGDYKDAYDLYGKAYKEITK